MGEESMMSGGGSPKVLATRGFAKLFWRLVGLGPSSLVVVSPFVGGFKMFPGVVEFTRYLLRGGDCAFTLVTRPPRKSSVEGWEGIITQADAEVMALLGARLVIRPKPLLHSKVYQFSLPSGKIVGFVGSANFSRGGFERNDESVAVFSGTEENLSLSAEIARLMGPGSTDYGDWLLSQGKLRVR